MDLTKLGRNERVLAIIGLLAFIDSFLPWYSASVKGSLAGLAGVGGSASDNAWSVGVGGWFPLLLLVAVGALIALPAFGKSVAVRGGYAAFGSVALLATIIILIRWLTYPSVPAEAKAFIDAGADFGTYIGLILGIAATVFSYLGFTAAGGSVNNFADAFKANPGAQAGYPSQDQPNPGPWQQPPQ